MRGIRGDVALIVLLTLIVLALVGARWYGLW